MNYIAKLHQKTFPVAVIKKNGEYHVTVEGKNFVVPPKTLQNFLKIHLVERRETHFHFSIEGQSREIDFTHPRDYTFASSNVEHKMSDLRASIPGRVVKICVRAGDQVKTGDPILVLEAMKMENELKAKHDCRIKKINVTEGQAVETNFALVSFEE